MAVIIWRVMHSSANARNDGCSSSGLKSRMALYRPIMPSCTMSSWSAPMRKYAPGLGAHKVFVLIKQILQRRVVALLRQKRQFFVGAGFMLVMLAH